LQLTDLAKSLFTLLFSGEYLSLILKPILPLAWGPWTPWTHNPVLDLIITNTIYGLIAFGAVYIAVQLMALLGIALVGSALTAFQLAVGIIVDIALNCWVSIQWWWRVRADPVNGFWETQAHFRVQQALPPYAYVYYSGIWQFQNYPSSWIEA
jgi:hypothetical protein